MPASCGDSITLRTRASLSTISDNDEAILIKSMLEQMNLQYMWKTYIMMSFQNSWYEYSAQQRVSVCPVSPSLCYVYLRSGNSSDTVQNKVKGGGVLTS